MDEGRQSPLVGSRLHDFGFRGCTCVEQSVLGGVAHLLNFDGSDTLSAAYYAQVETALMCCCCTLLPAPHTKSAHKTRRDINNA